MISKTRAKRIADLVDQHSIEEVMFNEGLPRDTVERYLRLNKQFLDSLSLKMPKILLFDIETLPMHVTSWTLFKPMLNHNNILKDWCIVSWAGKWLFDADVFGDVLTSKEAVKRDDKRICTSLHEIFNKADVIIAHNLKKFDRKKTNTRFKLNGLNPPSSYHLIDTLEVARKEFAMSSNRLDYLGQIMCNDEKIGTNWALWQRCDAGEEAALEEMMKYNLQDVTLLEEVYLELRPWIKSHPNLSLFNDVEVEQCTVCLNTELDWGHDYYTMAGRFAGYRCPKCNNFGRSRYGNITKEKRRAVLSSNAR